VDDSADATMTTMYLNVSGGKGALTGNLAGAEIDFTDGWVTSLTLKGGTNTDSFYLYNTPTSYAGPKYTTTLVLGNNTNYVGLFGTTGGIQVQTPNGGTDWVWIGNDTTNAIKGWIDFSGTAAVNMYLDLGPSVTYTVTASQTTWQKGTSTPIGVTYGNLTPPLIVNGQKRQGPISLSIWNSSTDTVNVDPAVWFPVNKL
jgi:hypothetical protein